MRLDFAEIRENARGRWLSIWRNLGITVPEDGKHGPCPVCSQPGKDSDRFRLDKNSAETGSYYCNGCGPASDGFTLVTKVLNIDIKEAMESVNEIVGSCKKDVIPKEKNVSPEYLRELFTKSRAVNGTCLVSKYLSSRGLSSHPGMLRHSRQCWESETKKNQHAMLAVVSAPDGKAITMHRTYLNADSNKLDIKKPKKIITPIKKINGGAIRLYDADGDILGIAEGIETAIAAYMDFNIPFWSVISNTIMESFEPPPHIKKVIIVSDNDSNYAGQKSAFILANRLSVVNKISVSVYIPNKPGTDWLDQTTGVKK